MKFVAFFDQSEAAVNHFAGGKGANLIAMSIAGFNVPEGFVISAAAYRQFISSAAWLDDTISQLDHEDTARLEQQCVELRRRLCESPLPPEVALEIRTAVARLGNFPVAVRSSSTFEDLADAAFAGQHDTYLNVSGEEAILGRVRACFASLWEARAVLYRHHHGFVHRDAHMAVAVQRQIACDAAGVAFSIDPVGGRMDRIIVDGSYGIGESVVSGDGEVDHFDIEKSTLNILQRSIGNKLSQIVPGGSSVERTTVAPDRAGAPCITDQQVIEVARLARRVEEHYGWPQDIEWGIAGGSLHLLQARPVTTLQPDWTRDESAERFPNPMTPLSWDFIRAAFETSLKHSLALMGLPALKGDWFRIFDHYIYGNQNAVRLLAMFRPLRSRSVPELIDEIPSLRRRFGWVMDLPVNWARDLDGICCSSASLKTFRHRRRSPSRGCR
jgi:phosphoenolpyruvate synthase/pyruvate phosphate dikinase